MYLVAGHFRLNPCFVLPGLLFLLSLFAILRTLVPSFCLARQILRDARDGLNANEWAIVLSAEYDQIPYLHQSLQKDENAFLHIGTPREDGKIKSCEKHGMSCDLYIFLGIAI